MQLLFKITIKSICFICLLTCLNITLNFFYQYYAFVDFVVCFTYFEKIKLIYFQYWYIVKVFPYKQNYYLVGWCTCEHILIFDFFYNLKTFLVLKAFILFLFSIFIYSINCTYNFQSNFSFANFVILHFYCINILY